MPRDFKAAGARILASLPKAGAAKDPKSLLRLALGVLVAANLVAGWMVVRPLGGGPVELRRQVVSMRRQVVGRRASLIQIRRLSSKVALAKTEGDQFLTSYFLGRRTLSSAIEAELVADAQTSGIKTRDRAYSIEPVEGSDDLSMMTITANFEGTYPQLIHLVNLLDRSKLLLIIDSLQATPEQGSGLLSVGMKLNAFVRESAQ